MPNLLVIDDEQNRTEYLKKELEKISNDEPYNVERVKNWAELKKKLNRDYQILDMVIFDVDFSNLPDEELLRSSPQLESDGKYQGYLLLKALRKWETFYWQEKKEKTKFVKVIFTSAKVRSIAGWEEEIEKYLVETYLYNEASPDRKSVV